MAYEIPGFSFTLVAAADFSATSMRAVNVDAAGKAALPAAGGRIVGVRQNRPGLNEATTVVNSGITYWEAGAAIAVGANVESDATGRCITRTAGVPVGVALEAASAAGVKIAVLLSGAVV